MQINNYSTKENDLKPIMHQTKQEEVKWSAEEVSMLSWLNAYIDGVSRKSPMTRYITFYKWCQYEGDKGPKHSYAQELLRQLRIVKVLIEKGTIA